MFLRKLYLSHNHRALVVELVSFCRYVCWDHPKWSNVMRHKISKVHTTASFYEHSVPMIGDEVGDEMRKKWNYRTHYLNPANHRILPHPKIYLIILFIIMTRKIGCEKTDIFLHCFLHYFILAEHAIANQWVFNFFFYFFLSLFHGIFYFLCYAFNCPEQPPNPIQHNKFNALSKFGKI